MTRKQAITLAMQALSEAGQNEEAIEVLRIMREELPLTRWTDATIRDSVEQFILDHGRPPIASEFRRRDLPPHTVIKNKYGITLNEWLYENYPGNQEIQEMTRRAATERFIQEYNRIRPKSSDKFNMERSEDCCCWYTVARYNQTTTWRALLEKLDLPNFSNVRVPEKEQKIRIRLSINLDDYDPDTRRILIRMAERGELCEPADRIRVIQKADIRNPAKLHTLMCYSSSGLFELEGKKKKNVEEQ